MAAPHNLRTDIAEKHSSNAEVALNASHHNVLLQHLTAIQTGRNHSPHQRRGAFFAHGRFATSMCNTLWAGLFRAAPLAFRLQTRLKI